jgi:hypothetical protein
LRALGRLAIVRDSMNRRRRDQQAEREHHEDQTGESDCPPRGIVNIEAILEQRLELEAEGDLRAQHLHAQLVQTDFQQRVEIGPHAASIHVPAPSSLQELPAGRVRLAGLKWAPNLLAGWPSKFGAHLTQVLGPAR